ncbi:hypothetical protein NFI96_029462, partial [Prochilodus magdalenae]
GHARVYFLLHSVTHCEEVFVVLEGSTLQHVLQTKFHRLLYFITPGHNQQETVCVRAYTRVGGVLRCVGVAFLTFVEDDAQELAEYMVTHSNHLSTTECSDVIGRYSLRDSSRRLQMDRRVTLALTNTHTPHSLLGQLGQESLLHLCVRLGFVCVCEFLLCQPGALMMINSANQNGDTPLQLAHRTNQHEIIHLLTHPPNPLTTPLGGVSQVWIGQSCLLRFSHTFSVMSLSVCLPSAQLLHSAVLLLAECVSDSTLANTIKELCVGSRAGNGEFMSAFSDEPKSRESPHAVVPYSYCYFMYFSFRHKTYKDSLLICSTRVWKPASAADVCVHSLTEFNSVYILRMFLPPDPDDTKVVNESTKDSNEELTAEMETEQCSTLNILQRRNNNIQVSLTFSDSETQKPLFLFNFSASEFRTDSVSNPQQLKAFNNCSILLYSSSQSSPALFISHNNTETRRRRSNSEGCGHELIVRKSWSISEDSTSCPLTQSSADAPLDYTAESWSALVDAEFLNTWDRRVIKRQEIIYELMQTEFHHVQTLTVMVEVLRRGLLEEVQLEEEVICQIFPSLDDLITLHRNFLSAMETRRQSSSIGEKYKNFIIQRIGDILQQQFCGCVGEQVMKLYGDFCSKHSDALRVYKQLQQNNRKLQLFIRQQSSNSVIKRREIPEFLLLITQRITKYPVLLERLLHYTEEGSVEQRDVAAALEGLKGVLAGVELHVCRVQQAQKLDDIVGRLDPKSCTRLKSGEIFSKHTLTNTTHTLTHSATLTCRTTSGRLREVLALLLTDVLVFLQEKEQKFTFAALEQKPAVVPLKGLIWREIANQERGLFLISSDPSAGPEMYEIHTNSREERNTWITHLQQTTHSLSDSAGGELKSNEEQKMEKIQNLQEAVFSVDLQVCAALEEKLCVCVCAGGRSVSSLHLLVQPHHYTLHTQPHIPQGFTLLQDAQREVVNLILTLTPWFSPYCDFNPNAEELSMPSLIRNCPLQQMDGVLVTAGLPIQIHLQHSCHNNMVSPFTSSHQVHFNYLSYQAVVIIQDSLFEVQKLLLLEDEAPSPWLLTDCVDVK